MVLCYSIRHRPYLSQECNFLLIFNESLLLLWSYLIIGYSGLNNNLKTYYNMGYVQVIIYLFALLVNLGVLIKNIL